MIHANVICRIEKYDPQTGIGDLEPLFLDDEGNPLPKIINARAQRQRLRLPKKLILEGGAVNHSPISDGGMSHTITGGNMTFSYDDSDIQEIVIYPHYERGDIVLACIPDRDISDAIQGRKGNGGSTEAHELASAIIIGLVGDTS